MVDNPGGKSGRRGQKKGRKRGGGTGTTGGDNASPRAAPASKSNDPAAPREEMESFPIVSDSRFSSMHNAPVRVHLETGFRCLIRSVFYRNQL